MSCILTNTGGYAVRGLPRAGMVTLERGAGGSVGPSHGVPLITEELTRGVVQGRAPALGHGAEQHAVQGLHQRPAWVG